MKKRIMSVLLAVLMMMSIITSCTSKPTENSKSASTSSEAEKVITEEMKFKMSEKLVVSTAKNVYDVKIYPAGQTPDANDVYTALDEVMNIKFQNLFAVPNDAYKSKVKLGMVSGELPDIFTADEQDLAELIKNDLLEDLTPYVEKYASENLKKVLDYNNGIAKAPSTRNGKLYAMPNISDALNSVPVLWIRKDWLANLKMSAPKTPDEFVALAKAFTTMDPDKNKKNDTFGLAISKELDMRFTSVANLFGAYPKIYMNNAGKFTYGSTAPEVKIALSKFRELYQAKAIDQEFATKDFTKMTELVAQGKVGMFVGEFYSSLWPLNDVVKLVKGSDFVGVPMPAVDFKPHVRINAMGAHVVKKGFKHPEAIVVYLNNIVEAGYESADNAWSKKWVEISTKYPNGVNNWMPMLFDLPDANASKLVKFKKADETKDTSMLRPNQLNLYKLIELARGGDMTNWAWPKVYYEGVESALSYKNLVFDAWYLPPTDTTKQKGAALKTLEDTAFINMIVGSAPISDFDKFVSDWKSQGGDQILAEMGAAK